jgi:hypothetical protein
MSRSRLVRTFILAATGLTLLVFVSLWGYYPLKGFVFRTFRLPDLVSQPFIAELQVVSALDQRRQFLDAWRAGATAGLRRQVSTVEGDPLHLWAITEKSGLTLVTDFTRDRHSHRGILVQHPSRVTLWQGRDCNPLRAWFPRHDEVYLRFSLAGGNDAFF